AAASESVGNGITAGCGARWWPRNWNAGRIDEDVERCVDIARLAKPRKRELRREPVPGECVRAATRERVAVGRSLRLGLGDLEEVATLVDRRLSLEVLDLD